jgi:hypothetical protein
MRDRSLLSCRSASLTQRPIGLAAARRTKSSYPSPSRFVTDCKASIMRGEKPSLRSRSNVHPGQSSHTSCNAATIRSSIDDMRNIIRSGCSTLRCAGLVYLAGVGFSSNCNRAFQCAHIAPCSFKSFSLAHYAVCLSRSSGAKRGDAGCGTVHDRYSPDRKAAVGIGGK